MGFRAFGPEHVAILLGTAALGAGLVRAGRRLRGAPAAAAVARVLAALMVTAFLLDPFVHRHQGELDWAHALPLQLCDAAGFAAIVALLTRRQRPFELTWFWALAGASQALLTPPFADDALAVDIVRYFVLHACIVVTPLYLGPGLGMRVRPGAWWRCALWTMAFAVLAGLVDWALEANYMWLREKPEGSILALFGPWPWYVLAGTAIGWILFFLLDLPWRLGRAAASD